MHGAALVGLGRRQTFTTRRTYGRFAGRSCLLAQLRHGPLCQACHIYDPASAVLAAGPAMKS